MLFILAPSKTMDFSGVGIKNNSVTIPQFQAKAVQLVRVIQAYENLAELMHVSPTLAEVTRRKYAGWGSIVKPAIYAYVGDVYKGFYASTLSKADVNWAQQHLRIMSGLYGMLRPLDEVSSYRLEMKARLTVDACKDLYDFWGSTLAEQADSEADGIICILSSDEYARPITRYAKSRIITPVFFDKKPDGTVGTVPIYSKMMRGVMARWAIDHRVSNPAELEKFSAQEYSYNKALSRRDRPAFYRESPRPIAYKK